MAIKETYASAVGCDGDTKTRYVRYSGEGVFVWCEVMDGYDVRQGTCEMDDLPQDIVNKALALTGCFPAYVEWPH